MATRKRPSPKSPPRKRGAAGDATTPVDLALQGGGAHGAFTWGVLDRLLENLPLLGTLYQSLKEVLGYDSARERFFQGVVAVKADEGYEIGFVTGQSAGPDGTPHTLVFVPSAPNPTNGKLLLVEPSQLKKLDVRTADALRALVSMGKTPLRP